MNDTEKTIKEFHGNDVWRDADGVVWVRQSQLVEAVRNAPTTTPTREQIAAAADERYPALNPDAEELTYPRSAIRDMTRGAFKSGAEYVVALLVDERRDGWDSQDIDPSTIRDVTPPPAHDTRSVTA